VGDDHLVLARRGRFGVVAVTGGVEVGPGPGYPMQRRQSSVMWGSGTALQSPRGSNRCRRIVVSSHGAEALGVVLGVDVTTPGPALAEELVAAIRGGDVDGVQRIVDDVPEIAIVPLGGRFTSRTALHVAADWPGFFPEGPRVVRLLLAVGADPNARSPGDETPLHWAASSDDVDVAAALIDGGADVEAPDGSIGTPLENAIGYACWQVAALLVARGARVDRLWHAAAMGMLDRLEELLAAATLTSSEVSQGFWHACSAGQRRAAERLLAAGADLNWVPDYAEETPLDAARGRGTGRDNLITWLQEQGATSTADGHG
jgi:hypothetical protein